MLITRALLFLVACATATTTTFPVYYNVDQGTAGMGGVPRQPYPPLQVDVTTFGIKPLNYTQGERGCILPSCFPWTSGAFPQLQCSSDGNITSIVNGGVPQAANLTLHLAMIQSQLPLWIPDSDWNGNAVIDFEAWTTVWEEMEHHALGPCYQNYSRVIVRQAEPSWDAAKVEAAAKEQWETAGTKWFAETLRACTAIRPAARWGFWGLPSFRSNFSMYATQQLHIFEASSAIYPSIYLSQNGGASASAMLVRNVVGETLKLAALVEASTGHRPQVLPYAWEFYLKSSGVLLSDADLNTSLALPSELGADGVVLWGSLHMVNTTTQATYWRYVAEKTGPLVERIHAGKLSAVS
jgi:hyaluronoglucosaminidase